MPKTHQIEPIDPIDALRRWMGREDLGRREVESLFGQLMDGALSDTQIAALLAALATKGETVEEIAGAAKAMRDRVVGIPHKHEHAVDTCGTGGDGKNTFNISTAAAVVAAAAGVPVAKHGNRSVSSRCGSADVLEELGVSIETDVDVAARCLNEIGIAFLFAPRLHPAMGAVMPVRKALAVRTVFNILGPLTNPAGARRQVLGVFDRALVDQLAHVLAELGSEHVLVVHGEDGLDELTITGATHVAELKDGAVRSYSVHPEDFGLARVELDSLAGGDVRQNAQAMRAVFSGTGGPLADVTGLNAGAAIYVGGFEETLAAGVARAVKVISSGAAQQKLEELIAFGRAHD